MRPVNGKKTSVQENQETISLPSLEELYIISETVTSGNIAKYLKRGHRRTKEIAT